VRTHLGRRTAAPVLTEPARAGPRLTVRRAARWLTASDVWPTPGENAGRALVLAEAPELGGLHEAAAFVGRSAW
jgi:hypothetical protein